MVREIATYEAWEDSVHKANQSRTYVLNHIGLKEPMLGQKNSQRRLFQAGAASA